MQDGSDKPSGDGRRISSLITVGVNNKSAPSYINRHEDTQRGRVCSVRHRQYWFHHIYLDDAGIVTRTSLSGGSF